MIPSSSIIDHLHLDQADVHLHAIQGMADRLLSWVETETGRHFREPKEFMLRFDGDGGTGLWLPELPLADEEEALLLTVAKLTAPREWETVPEEDYELAGAVTPVGPYLLEHVTGWPVGRRNIRVTFTAGYEFGSLPGDIEQMVLEMLAHRHREQGKEGLRSETIGGYSYTLADPARSEEMRPEWRATIARWRHLVFA